MLVKLTPGPNPIKLFRLHLLTPLYKLGRFGTVHCFPIALKWSGIQKSVYKFTPKFLCGIASRLNKFPNDKRSSLVYRFIYWKRKKMF
jgi:hypothetical protein